MIRIANAQFWVHDQDEALRFYTQALGWEVRADVTMEAWSFRWLVVAHPGQDNGRAPGSLQPHQVEPQLPTTVSAPGRQSSWPRARSTPGPPLRRWHRLSRVSSPS